MLYKVELINYNNILPLVLEKYYLYFVACFISEKGSDVLDIGCYVGEFNMTMAAQFPRSTFHGVDPCADGISRARETAASRAICNVSFVEGDAAQLPGEWSGKFEAVFLFDCFHDIPLATQACKEIKRVLKPGGHCIVRDINTPSDPAEQKKKLLPSAENYAFSLYMCLPLSMNTPNSEALGTGLGLQRITQMFEKAELKRVPEEELPLPEEYKYILVFEK